MAILKDTVVSGSLRVTDGVSSSYQNCIVTGTGTAGQAGSASAAYIPSLWTFNLGIVPVAGDMITIKIPIAGNSSGVWVSVDNGTTYYPVATIGKSRLTTHYPVNEIITLAFETSMVTTIYGTSKTGAAAGASAADYTSNRWVTINYYDSNTTYSAQSAALLTAGTDTGARTIRADVFKAGLKAVVTQTSGKVKVYENEIGVGLDQGVANAGKFLMVGDDGKVCVQAIPSANGNSF